VVPAGIASWNARRGSATASVTGGTPPVFRRIAAAALRFILRCLLPIVFETKIHKIFTAVRVRVSRMAIAPRV